VDGAPGSGMMVILALVGVLAGAVGPNHVITTVLVLVPRPISPWGSDRDWKWTTSIGQIARTSMPGPLGMEFASSAGVVSVGGVESRLHGKRVFGCVRCYRDRVAVTLPVMHGFTG